MVITIICHAGISSSLLVKKLEKYAEEKKLAVTFVTQAISQVKQQEEELVLLSPQAAYIRKQFPPHVLVYQITNFDYSSLNASHIMQEIENILSERNAHETGNLR